MKTSNSWLTNPEKDITRFVKRISCRKKSPDLPGTVRPWHGLNYSTARLGPGSHLLQHCKIRARLTPQLQHCKTRARLTPQLQCCKTRARLTPRLQHCQARAWLTPRLQHCKTRAWLTPRLQHCKTRAWITPQLQRCKTRAWLTLPHVQPTLSPIAV